jgi:hypothetical protein
MRHICFIPLLFLNYVLQEKSFFDSIAITQYTAELLAIVKVMCY